MSAARIKYVPLLGGWFVVRGKQHTPISGRFDSEGQARASLQRGRR
jgi:hypothetical protein